MEEVCIVIPAFNPSDKLLTLIDSLNQKQLNNIIVINDGSNAIYNPIFTTLKNKNIILLEHEKNKGAALKTAFHYILNNPILNDIGIVTADADLQHIETDIVMMCDQLKKNPDHLHLGVRTFQKNIPWRSLIGNKLTQFFYQLFYRQNITDTQTGLRSIPRKLLPLLCNIHNNGYEFELSMLILAKKNNIICEQHPITTVYIENNNSSHFNPLIDSIKIYWVMFRYLASSLSSYIIDFLLFILFYHLLSNLFLSILLPRIISGSYNFLVNHRVVFKSNKKLRNTLQSYLLLSIFTIISSFYLIKLFMLCGLHIYISKIIADSVIYFFNFYVQRFFVFASKI